MPRKGHKKSRNGCLECKKRHIKCDETPGPTCVNCKTAGIKCSYNDRLWPTPVSIAPSPVASPSITRSQSASTEPNFHSCNNETHTPPSQPAASVNLNHLELLHNFSTESYKSFTNDDGIAYRYMQTTVKTGLRYPWLMHELLALSALHLSICHPEQSAFYREQASSLQSLALEGCKEVLTNVNHANCVAVFLFASLTGMHSFCDTFTYRDGNFNNLLDKLTNSINLLRGVRIVTHPHWPTLLTSELSEIMDAGQVLCGNPADGHQECQPLLELVQNADISKTSFDAYTFQITELQRVFNAESLIDSGKGTVSMIFAWLVTSDAVYTDLLKQRRPEALIILAYYAVVLHHRRMSWAVQDAGPYLIRAITEYLGSHWAHWLDWPNAVIKDSETLFQSTF